MNFSFGFRKKADDSVSTGTPVQGDAEKPPLSQRQIVIYSSAAAVFVLGGGFLAYSLLGQQDVVPTVDPVVTNVDQGDIADREKAIYSALVDAGFRAEAETVKNHPFDPAKIDWSLWPTEVAKSEDLKLKLRENFAATIYKQYGITKEEAAVIMEKGMKETAWNATEEQMKKNGKAYFFTGAKQFMEGGDDNLLKAFSNFSVAAALGNTDAVVMTSRLKAAFKPEQIALVDAMVKETVAKVNAGDTQVAAEVEKAPESQPVEEPKKGSTKAKTWTGTSVKTVKTPTEPSLSASLIVPDSIGGPAEAAAPSYREPTWIDVEDFSDEKAFALGFKDGFKEGYDEGTVDGYDLGYDDGYEGRNKKTEDEIHDELEAVAPDMNKGRYRAVLQEAESFDRRSIWEGRSDGSGQ